MLYYLYSIYIVFLKDKHEIGANGLCNKNRDGLSLSLFLYIKIRESEKIKMAEVNKKHKDRLFCLLFGDERYKWNALALYNALNGTSYTNVDDFTIYMIDDVIYMGMKNDVAYLVHDELCLWEQQSTYNPNMPLRGLMYYGKMYDKYVSSPDYNIYGRKLVKIPNPKYVVFYNGLEKRPAMEILRLSDAFIREDKSRDFEWTATVINLNHKDLDSALLQCKALADYITFVQRVQNCRKSMDLETAVNQVVDECIRDGILAELLLQHKAEVTNMVLTEWNQEKYDEFVRKEAREEGLAEGLAEGLSAVINTAAAFTMDAKQIHAVVVKSEPYQNVTLEQVEEILAELSSK